ncbi:hypothetical protein ABTY59_31915 [Streptomyces sp. NPDC096079]|uniref:hypothetical protein n=1 Tax=Streptomyces sp. NPDC096079 TaxID=3155820 RepID=UPI003326344F
MTKAPKAPKFHVGWGDTESDTLVTAQELEVAEASSHQASTTAVEERIAEAVREAQPGLHKIPDPVLPEGDGPLTPAEEKRLRDCQGGVALGNDAWFIQGKALDTIAVGRLFRTTPHKLEPERCYASIEEWAPLEAGIPLNSLSKLRAGWAIGEVLAARGYPAIPGQVRELVPVKNQFNLNAAIAVYVLVADSVGANKVTAERLRDIVKLLPVKLELDEDDDVDALAKTIKGVLVDEVEPVVSRAIPPAVTRAVDKQSLRIADALNRSRIPRTEVTLHLMQAFTDQEDTTVFDAVLERMKQAEKDAKQAAKKALG